MADNAPITPAAPAATFDVAVWLSRFESVGGNYLATKSQTSFCLACEELAPGQSPAHAMLRELTDQQRAAVVTHIRTRAGLSPTSLEKTRQPDLNAIPSEKVSETAGIPALSGGHSLDLPEGSHDMDMTHAFAPVLATQRPKDWDSALAEYEAAQACSNALRKSDPLSDAARDACCEALDHLVENVRAPSLQALSYKIGLSQKHWETWGRPDEWLQAFQADLDSLAKPALSAASCTKPDLADNSAADETERNGWDQLFKAYQTAKAAEDTYDADVWSPTQKRQDEFEAMVGIHGYTHETGEKRRALMAKFPNEYVPHDVNREIERLQGVRIDLERALMDMPAPDLDALRWKLSLQRRLSEDFVIAPEVFDMILAELDRLFGKAASPCAYFVELDAVDALAQQVDTEGFPASETERWEQWSMRVWREIEALPTTQENAPIKARAVLSIIGGDLEGLNDGQTTACRLIRQIVLALGRPPESAAIRPDLPLPNTGFAAAAEVDLTAAEKAADAAGDVFYAALEKLFAIPAPDLSHVLEKMKLAHQHGEELNAFTHVMGDLRRLIGGIAITDERRTGGPDLDK
ncbi:hypothetical protein J2X73_004472 [Novosphingobium sp. 1748]|uniref:hypothetical protein n=2 Tax=Novosphingobium TaxID=165696 RepID=UPI000AA5C048|nr:MULTISPECIES: hypothetical protein [unclassified Novosphingobium]MBN9146232.1 hypothetical protein [Novosphingobium sp.]MDR6710073.1 hypothetical protein [Novosphingobium sp. 1748]